MLQTLKEALRPVALKILNSSEGLSDKKIREAIKTAYPKEFAFIEETTDTSKLSNEQLIELVSEV